MAITTTLLVATDKTRATMQEMNEEKNRKGKVMWRTWKWKEKITRDKKRRGRTEGSEGAN